VRTFRLLPNISLKLTRLMRGKAIICLPAQLSYNKGRIA